MRVRGRSLVAAVLLPAAAAGCGGGGNDTAAKAPPGTMPLVTVAADTVRGCRSVSASEVEQVSGHASVHVRDLAPGPTLRCSTVFFGDVGELIVTVSERTGGAAALRGLRATSVDEFGTQGVRPTTELGAGAFLAKKRVLAFRRGDLVVTLETGYDRQGRLSLSRPQLIALARAVH